MVEPVRRAWEAYVEEGHAGHEGRELVEAVAQGVAREKGPGSSGSGVTLRSPCPHKNRACDFERRLEKKTVPRKTNLLEQGQNCDFIAFIGEGIYRFYHIQDGEEKITAFFFSGDFVTNYRSFLTGQPSSHYIEAMKDSVIYIIRRADLHELYAAHQSIERIGRLIAENLYLLLTKRLDAFMNSTPEERYQDLLLRNSNLLQEVPQYMLASYLGVKPESLSRIRARM
ncbi:MAG: Crp/Fnr family transcriptional regulator [Synechococcaceae cyanobacterium SM2_3_60]|nr:Crp/Fnr family transcriptional regulator [Synechococcaceae cyanobacterium SM2_3_60]